MLPTAILIVLCASFSQSDKGTSSTPAASATGNPTMNGKAGLQMPGMDAGKPSESGDRWMFMMAWCRPRAANSARRRRHRRPHASTRSPPRIRIERGRRHHRVPRSTRAGRLAWRPPGVRSRVPSIAAARTYGADVEHDDDGVTDVPPSHGDDARHVRAQCRVRRDASTSRMTVRMGIRSAPCAQHTASLGCCVMC